jgi:ribulose-phosphate 3-epimerase
MVAALAPSILSADFADLGNQVRQVEAGGAGLVHVDVMDGHFVPNITIGPVVVAALKQATSLPLDCHLMIENPERYVNAFIEAGAAMISVHVEAARHLHGIVQQIQAGGAEAGVVLNPATPLAALDGVLPDVDFVLLMSVNPGFGGQKLIRPVLEKVRALRQKLDGAGLDCSIEIDGGVTVNNLAEVAATGVDRIVSGSAIFGTDDIQGTTEKMVKILSGTSVHGRV